MRKHQLTSLLLILSLAGCAGSTSSVPSDPAPSAPEETPAAEVSELPETRTEDSEALKAYQAEMEPYEDLEIVFLGTLSSERTMEDILKRAEEQGIEPVSAVGESRIIYGDRGEYEDYVYLLVPAENTNLKVGRYNWYAGEITQVWIDEPSALPLIYVESADSIDPFGKIEYVRHVSDGDIEGFLYTGLTAAGKLRTDYHMGVVDRTAYEQFTSAEIPFYRQMFFDQLMTYEEIADKTAAGGQLSMMEEMTWDGHAYMVYDLSLENKSTLYGVSYDPMTREIHVIVSRDSGVTWESLGHG